MAAAPGQPRVAATLFRQRMPWLLSEQALGDDSPATPSVSSTSTPRAAEEVAASARTPTLFASPDFVEPGPQPQQQQQPAAAARRRGRRRTTSPPAPVSRQAVIEPLQDGVGVPGAAPIARNVGPREPLSTLIQEFRFNTSFASKVRRLEQRGYTGWRRIRGDGNCFYRAVGFGLLEQLVVAPERERISQISSLYERIAALEFADALHAAEHKELLARVDRLKHGAGWEEPGLDSPETPAFGLLYSSLHNPKNSADLALLRALRRLAADYLLSHAHDAAANHGISYHDICVCAGEYVDVSDFCNKVVLPDGVEAETLCQSALPAALGVGVRIAFLDRGDAQDVTFHDFGVDVDSDDGAESSPSARPLIHVQLRPGHYDLLYFRDAAATSSGLSSEIQPGVPQPQRSSSAPPSPSAQVAAAASASGKPPTLGNEDFGELQLLPAAPSPQKSGRGSSSARRRERAAALICP